MSAWQVVSVAAAVGAGIGAGTVSLIWLRRSRRSRDIGKFQINLHRHSATSKSDTAFTGEDASTNDRPLQQLSYEALPREREDQWFPAFETFSLGVATLPITIYLSDESVHEQVEQPLRISWYRSMATSNIAMILYLDPGSAGCAPSSKRPGTLLSARKRQPLPHMQWNHVSSMARTQQSPPR